MAIVPVGELIFQVPTSDEPSYATGSCTALRQPVQTVIQCCLDSLTGLSLHYLFLYTLSQELIELFPVWKGGLRPRSRRADCTRGVAP